MAITVTSQISGQVATSISTYCYLFEPMRVFCEESDLSATKLYIDVQPFNTGTGVPTTTLVKYAEYDINPGKGITVDLMKIIQQISTADVWKVASVNDLVGANGWERVIAQHRYKFHIYTDKTVTPVTVYKLPIIGHRTLQQFTANVTQSSPANEFQYYGLDETELQNRWEGVSLVRTSFNDPAAGGSVRPTLTKVTNAGTPPCGGFLIWKSRFGGWMWWGFDIMTETQGGRHIGSLEVGMFESTADKNGSPYVPVDYTGYETNYSMTLKSLGVSKDELKAIAGISASPAVYFQYPGSDTLELMKVTSASAPISTVARGGDFSVSLSNISRLSQNVI